MTVTLVDRRLEAALLVAVLRHPGRLPALLGGERLSPEHFGSDDLREVFAAIVQVSDEGSEPSPALVASRLEGRVPDPYGVVRPLREAIAAGGDVDPAGIARQMKQLWARRRVRLAAALLDAGATEGSSEKIQAAEQLLSAPQEGERSTFSPDDRGEAIRDRLTKPAVPAWEWPWSKLNDLTGGGLRRGQVCLLGGFSGHGKSILLDQLMEGFAAEGLRCHTYLTEMTVEERDARALARACDVPFSAIYSGRLSAEQRETLKQASYTLKTGFTEAAGWTAQDIARHIRWNRWDVCAVDIVHEIAHKDERELAQIAGELSNAARQSKAALMLCVHLNDLRATGTVYPTPTLRDVRGTGMLVRGADIVLMVHRRQQETGDDVGTLLDGALVLAQKVRNGHTGAFQVRLFPEDMRFVG